jgi:galactoside O-acetyltransferase
MTSFYSPEELQSLGIKSFGEEVLISRKASIYGAEQMEIGSHVRIDDFCVLSGKICLGSYIHIAPLTLLCGGPYGIEAEDFANIGSRCAIYAQTDDFSGNTLTNPTVPDLYKNVTGGKVLVKRHAIIATGSTILPCVTIGEGCGVGAMSLVTKNLVDWGIYAGIPCRRIKERSKKLLELEGRLI